MVRRFSVDFAIFSMLLDAIWVSLALALSALLRPVFGHLAIARALAGPVELPLLLYPVASIVWVIVLALLATYDARRNLRWGAEFRAVTLGSVLAAVALAGLLYLSFREVSRFLFVFFVFLAYVLLVAWRLAFRVAFHWGALKANEPRRVLIAGRGLVGVEIEARVREHRHRGFEVVGFLDDDPDKATRFPDVVGSLEAARAVIADRAVTDVVIALPRRAHERLNTLVVEMHDLPVKVWLVPDYFSLALHRAAVGEVAGIPLLDLRAPALSEYQRMTKRAFDLVVTLLLLPFALPLAALIALAIRLDSPGPVVFRQKRAGENGRVFEMYKFRTMVAEAESLRHLVVRRTEDGDLLHKAYDDPRVTRVGRLLRRISLDELPQLLNVLRGEMSLVGPRPELPELVERYEPWQRKRFAVPQGLTGWWQVSGRSNKPMHLHTEDDLYYVQNYSLWLDLQILVRTVGAVLTRRGAY